MFQSKPIAIVLFFALPAVGLFIIVSMYDARPDPIMGGIVSIIAGGVVYGIASSLLKFQWQKPAKPTYESVNLQDSLENSEIWDLTSGIMLSKEGGPPRMGRRAKCRSCGKIWQLSAAKIECLDWDGVNAYHFYCPNCYQGTGDPYYYTGQLMGGDGKAVIDQYDYTHR